jgi:nucleoside-diphosphate-sugar epimerase
MEICIIGCTGYLGSKISEHLYKKGHQLYGVCRKFPKDEIKFKNYFHKIIEGDITNESFVKKIVSLKIEKIIYTISLNHINSEKILKNSIDVNYLPILRLCSLIKDKNIKSRLIYFSTMQVYGSYEKILKINEDQVKNAENVYALTHSLCEDTLRLMNKYENFESISLRLSNGYGYPKLKSCDCWWLVINDFCKNAIENKEIKLNSDGSSLRDFIHISDISVAVEKLITTTKKIPEKINLASGKTLSMLEIAKIVNDISNKYIHKTKVFIKNKEINNCEIKKRINLISNNKKFRVSNNLMKKFNINPKIDLRSGIKRTLIEINKSNNE